MVTQTILMVTKKERNIMALGHSLGESSQDLLMDACKDIKTKHESG